MDYMIFEIIGYVASVVTAFSLTMKNIRRLRWWNLLGAAFFSAYGALIGAWPVFALNGFVVLVDIYYLYDMSRTVEYFDLIKVDIQQSVFSKLFLDFYKKDIEEFFPKFSYDPNEAYQACFCVRNARPVNLILARKLDDQKVLIDLDYAIPEYRDMKSGRYFYKEGIKKLGFDHGQEFICKNVSPKHKQYLKTIGFKQAGVEDGYPVFKK